MTDARSSASAAVQDKLDPETFALRARPGRVMQFRRGAIVAITGLGSVAIAGVVWMALKPANVRIVAGGDDRAESRSSAPPEAIANAPKSYGDVPQLGPPLPGDLGRPILEHQRSLGEAMPSATTDQAVQAAEAERQRIIAERQAARESGVMMQIAGASRTAPAREAAVAIPATAGTSGERLALDPDRDPGSQRHKADFLNQKDETSDINPHALTPSASPYVVSAGTVIAASLITGLNSDLPGLVTAQVTENVYDTVTGRILLIPQGARMIGAYDSVVAFGQKRALVVWQRIILPDGSSIRLDNVPATDTAGYVGLADEVDLHSWQLLKGVALSTLLGVGTELSFGDESDLVRALRESTQQSASRAGDQIVMKNLAVQPTIRVRPGWPLRVVVHKDIIFPRPWRTARR
ncbi:conjugal transfer protein TrbI [Sphingomonas histidinilytica]|uniref:Type IV secretion system protein VirB10 n=1 Tax=Rhizorhabdus histidinilytica TaxID=439228 RepID=A0A1T5EHU9_9SPHN|nr:TrbI/VirB10 family protein [Rhizorhabdus histidinilytica]MBO9380621.1 conjugal transfer protein TrbI [Rhizorhabdus histidinilytica]SKB83481.1 type IV secretion system protein VirB10 [Rhizorhabdus histidinilytica]